MGTAMALDGFFIEIKKPDGAALNGKNVDCLITQLGCDSNGKIRFLQTDWPGATNDISCFRAHIVCDEAYSALSVEYHKQIITPYSSYQINTAKHNDNRNETIGNKESKIIQH